MEIGCQPTVFDTAPYFGPFWGWLRWWCWWCWLLFSLLYIDDVFKLLWLNNSLQLLFPMSIDESSRGGKLCQWNKIHRSPEVGHHGAPHFPIHMTVAKSNPGSEVFSIRCFWCFFDIFWTSDYQIFQEKCLHQPAFASLPAMPRLPILVRILVSWIATVLIFCEEVVRGCSIFFWHGRLHQCRMICLFVCLFWLRLPFCRLFWRFHF